MIYYYSSLHLRQEQSAQTQIKVVVNEAHEREIVCV